jgi:hypothetical protein
VAVLGARGAGKSSLVLHLALGGAPFFTDDVLALEAAGAHLLAHPGFGVVNVRLDEYERLGEAARVRLGEPLGRTARQKLHFALMPERRALPLRALAFVVPGDGAASTVRPLREPDPVRLLAGTFIHESRSPPELARLLNVCARLAEQVPMFEIRRGAAEDAATLAARLRDQLGAEVAV